MQSLREPVFDVDDSINYMYILGIYNIFFKPTSRNIFISSYLKYLTHI